MEKKETKAVVIDATNLILGRLASLAAKKALKGEEVIIINAEKCCISGRREQVFERYKFKRDVGDIYKGPFMSRMPDRLVRRTVRGMVPRKKAKGREAYKRVKVYIGKPDDIKGDVTTIKDINIDSLKDRKFVRMEDVCRWLGAKW